MWGGGIELEPVGQWRWFTWKPPLLSWYIALLYSKVQCRSDVIHEFYIPTIYISSQRWENLRRCFQIGPILKRTNQITIYPKVFNIKKILVEFFWGWKQTENTFCDFITFKNYFYSFPMHLLNQNVFDHTYRTRAIITRSWFETADFRLNSSCLVHKLSNINRSWL